MHKQFNTFCRRLRFAGILLAIANPTAAVSAAITTITMEQYELGRLGGDHNPAFAEVVMRHGAIHTQDRHHRIVSAVAIRDGKFVYAGNDRGLSAYIGPTTQTVDLQGRMALPGFIDSHIHPSLSTVLFQGLLLEGESHQGYLEQIRTHVQRNPGLNVLVGMGWKNPFEPLSGPTSGDLDAIVSHIPAAFFSEDGHSMWLNTLAMQRAGLADLEQDPPGSRIERDPGTRQPLGTIREWGAEYRVIKTLLPKPDPGELLVKLKTLFSWLNSKGITTVQDAACQYGEDGVATDAMEQLAQRGELTVRVRCALYGVPFNDPKQIDAYVEGLLKERRQHQTELLQANSVKFLVDGVVEGRTALLERPYKGESPPQRGLQLWDQEVLNQLVLAIHRAGFQAHFHVIGDRATHLALDALEYSAKRGGGGNHRDILTHLQLVRPKDFRRFAKLDAIAVPVPQWALRDNYFPFEIEYLGRQRAERLYPLRSFIKAGVRMASSSDFPASVDPDPLRSIQAGMMRWLPELPKRVPSWPAERIKDIEVLLDSFTRDGAYANFLENTAGSIEVGKSADLVVLDADLTKIRPRKIVDTRVLMTLFQGKVVWQANP